MTVSPLDSTNPQGVVVQKPRSDVYTTMLFLSFLAILVACLCLYLEMKAYNMDIKAVEAAPGAAAVAPNQPPSWRIDLVTAPGIALTVV